MSLLNIVSHGSDTTGIYLGDIHMDLTLSQLFFLPFTTILTSNLQDLSFVLWQSLRLYPWRNSLIQSFWKPKNIRILSQPLSPKTPDFWEATIIPPLAVPQLNISYLSGFGGNLECFKSIDFSLLDLWVQPYFTILSPTSLPATNSLTAGFFGIPGDNQLRKIWGMPWELSWVEVGCWWMLPYLRYDITSHLPHWDLYRIV